MEADDLNKINSEDLTQESSWRNYFRMIDKNLILLNDLKRSNFHEFDKFRFIGKLELQRQLKTSLSKLGPVNYVTKNLINELKICFDFEEKIKLIISFIEDIVDKIEFKVIEMLKFCERCFEFIENDENDYKAKLEEKIFESYKIFSKK
jgi:hypothetical protein